MLASAAFFELVSVGFDSDPAVTFLLLTYNQGRFVRDALRAALAQDYSPLTVVCVDDCSPDDTFAVLQVKRRCMLAPTA